MIRKAFLLLYYGFLRWLPMQPLPGGAFFCRLRFLVVKRIIRSCGDDVWVPDRCYFGDGTRLSVGARSLIGQNARLNGDITLGNDVMLGQDVVMMAVSHRYDRLDVPIIAQGAAEERPIVVGDGAWIGTRAIILPGVEIGHDSIVAAGAVVSRSCPPYSIVAGVPAKVIKDRRTRESGSHG
jgi:maltose O-acetyltransferase